MKRSENSRVVVTGASGFIGRHFTNLLVRNGFEVASVKARYRSGRPTISIRNSRGGAGSGRSESCFPSDGIWVHLGALRGERPLAFRAYLDANVSLTRELLDIAMRHRARKFVFVSTVGVQGWPRKLPVNESVPPHPSGYYHVSKLVAEQEALEASRRGLPVTIVRPALTYGPHDRDGLIPKLVRMAANSVCCCPGTGMNRLHLIEVSDLADGLLKACLHGGNAGRIYILAGPEPCTLRELLIRIRKNLGATGPCLPIPKALVMMAACLGEARFRLSRKLGVNFPGERYLPTFQQVRLLTRDRFYDIQRARSELGFNPRISPETGIARLIKSMGKNSLIGASLGSS